MGEIKVSTTELRNGAKQLSDSTIHLREVQNQLFISSIKNPQYGIQLAAKLADITSGYSSMNSRLQNRSAELSAELLDRARKFEQANQVGFSGVEATSSAWRTKSEAGGIGLFSGMRKLKSALLWSLGGFFVSSLFRLTSWIPKMQNPLLPKPQFITLPYNQHFRREAGLSGESLDVLPKGTRVIDLGIKPVTKDDHEWVNVRTSDGREGWVALLKSEGTEKEIKPQVPVTEPAEKDKSEHQVSNYTGSSAPPVQGGDPRITQGVHMPDSVGQGIDIGASDYTKAEIHSIRDGRVVEIREDKGDGTGWGNMIKILQDDGKVVLYGHLKDKPELTVGTPVKAGDKLGMMGNTGRSDGYHLHLDFREASFNSNNEYLDDKAKLVPENFHPITYLEEQGVTFSNGSDYKKR